VFRASAISALTIRDFSSRPWHETTSHVVVEVHMVGSTYVHEIPIDPQLSHDEAHAEAARTIREIADSMRKAAEDFA
jgi:DNA-binding protein YbaB